MPWVSYADHFEDVILFRALGDISSGFYVDIEPDDPTKGSLTKHFSDRGWRGINILSDRETYEGFCRLRPKDRNLVALQGEEGSAVASDKEEAALPALDAILEKEGIRTIHFLKAAAEGWPEKLLRRFPFSRVKPWIVILVGPEGRSLSTGEDHGPSSDPFLASQGYELAYGDGRSQFYLAREQMARKDRVAAPPCLADDFVPRYAVDGLQKQSAEQARMMKLLSQEVGRLRKKNNPFRRAERMIRLALRRKGKPSMGRLIPTDLTVAPSVGTLEVRRLSGIQLLGNRLGEKPRILVLQLDHIGDFIGRLPAFRLLRSLWPAAEVDLICGPWNLPLAQKLGFFRKVFPFSFFPEATGLWRPNSWEFELICSGFSSLASSLGDYDLAIDLRGLPDTRALLGLVRAKLRAGYAAPEANVVLDISLPDVEFLAPKETNRHRLHREVTGILLVRAVEAVLAPTSGARTHSLLFDAPRIAERGARLVAVAPGSGSTARKWKVEHYAAVCRRLAADHRCSILLVGSPREAADAERIVREIPSSQCRNLVGKISLAELPKVLAEAQVFVGNDSGASHIAASLGVPTVVAHSGAADFWSAHPAGEKVSILRLPISCSPCGLSRAEECPFGTACLEGISPEAVVREVLFWLGEEVGSEPSNATGCKRKAM